MLIASVSDIHTDFPENREAVVRLATEIHERRADVVIVAGDVSHRNERIRRALRALREAAGVIAYVPGNHDLWFDVPSARDRGDLDTWHRYRIELREVAESAGAHYLPSSPLVVGDVAIVGSCGWYDYSLAPPWLRSTVTEEMFAAKQFGGVMWSDARFIAFRRGDGQIMGDGEVTRAMERDLRDHLDQVEQRPEVEHVVAATHHQAFYEIVQRTGTLPWEYFNAFMGSTRLGEAIQSSRKARTAIYGHSHLVGEHRIGQLRVFGTPLGYPRERRGLSDAEIVRTRIGWITT